MNHFDKFKQGIAFRLILVLVAPGIISFTAYLLLDKFSNLPSDQYLLYAFAAYILAIAVCYSYLINLATKPIEMIWQAIWHVSPQKSEFPPPKVDQLKLGRELLSSLITQIYDMASTNNIGHENAETNFDLIDSLPVAVLSIDNQNNVKAINKFALQQINKPIENVTGKNIYEVINLSFNTEETLEKWLENARTNKAIDDHQWENVKLSNFDDQIKRFDISAHYSKNDSQGNEIILVLFEKTKTYTVEEQATNNVAMAVHELRTPLTMLRGYIELFEEEIGENLDEEHKNFMRKMSATVQNLNAIVSNILNVTRIDENQFSLKLNEYNWGSVLKEIIDSIDLRAKVRNKEIILKIDDNLPTVGIDKISMYEVVVNLVDNAIKYSGQSNQITITAKISDEGNVETIIEDHGQGMPANVISGLFSKFYRSHKSRDAVSGNGLGLYIVKSIITAHGGNVWVRSKEGEGSKFGFTVLPYANLKDEVKNGNNDGIERHANGWIKNHSLYRR